MAKKNDGYKVLAANKTARHDYFIEETYEAGVVLTGTEIKSLRGGRASLRESFARIEGEEIFLHGMNISPYEHGNIYNVDPLRPRKLLLHKKEIIRLSALVQQDGLTLVPLRMYLNSKGLAKIEIAVAKGKKNYDKRESIAKRDTERRMQKLQMRRKD
jgi:SsrA-binding protein